MAWGGLARIGAVEPFGRGGLNLGDLIADGCCFLVLLEIDALLELLPERREAFLLGEAGAGSLGDLADMVVAAVVSPTQERDEFVGERLVALRTAEEAVLAELGERQPALRQEDREDWACSASPLCDMTTFLTTCPAAEKDWEVNTPASLAWSSQRWRSIR